MAVLHSRFTVIACRESWTRKTLLKIIGVLSAVKLNKLPTRGDSIWTNQSQWNGTQIKKVMDLPSLLFDLSTLHVLQTNYSCRREENLYWLKLMCKWQIFTTEFLLTYSVGKQWAYSSPSLAISLCFLPSPISWHFLLSQPWALLSAPWYSGVSALLTEQELFHFVWLCLRGAGSNASLFTFLFMS